MHRRANESTDVSGDELASHGGGRYAASIATWQGLGRGGRHDEEAGVRGFERHSKRFYEEGARGQHQAHSAGLGSTIELGSASAALEGPFLEAGLRRYSLVVYCTKHVRKFGMYIVN